MASSEVARLYAGALLDVAVAAGDDLDSLAKSLGELGDSIRKSPELATALSTPRIPRARRADLGVAVAERIAARSRLPQFVRVMVERERAEHIPETAVAFRSALDAHQGVVEAEVASARPLDESSRKDLEAALGKAFSEGGRPGRVRLSLREDPSLLGGLVVRIGNRIHDASLDRSLSRFLANAGAKSL